MSNFDEYRLAAMRTENYELPLATRLNNACLGLIGEYGEIADTIKKHLYHGHALDVAHLEKEIGDFEWYIAQMCDALNVGELHPYDWKDKPFKDIDDLANSVTWYLADLATLVNEEVQDIRLIRLLHTYMYRIAAYIGTDMPTVWRKNIEKLAARYPDGFSTEASINRVDKVKE